MTYDIRQFILSAREIVVRHELDLPGRYCRWIWQNDDSSRDLGVNPYGCTDAANILYTIGGFPQDHQERSQWVEALRAFQDPETGFFYESTASHELHTTAHCIAALELFDALPEYPLAGLSQYRDPKAMEAFLEELDWRGAPWGASHKGAGLYAAMVLAGEVSPEWEDRYFRWLYNETDVETGFFRKGCIGPIQSGHVTSIFAHLAGTFHYLFNHEWARRPLRYPQAMIDTCLDIFNTESFPLCQSVGFAEIDWVFCLTRSLRQCGHRYDECRLALERFTERYVGFLLGLGPQTYDRMNDLHNLFGALCCLAELQAALPGQIRTSRPLKLVLDRRPFI